MDFTARCPVRSNSESSTNIYTNSPEYQLNFKAYWFNNMYTTQHLDTPSKQHFLGGSVEENKKNYNFGNMYSAKHSLSADNMANQPKKESLWQSITRSATNLLGEHLTRGTNSFIKNWSNNPLSVTVVSPDFYKSLQRGKDQMGPPLDSFWKNKNLHSSDEVLPNILYDNEIVNDSVKKSYSDSADSDKRWKEYKCMYVNNFNETQRENLIKSEEIVNSVNMNNSEIESTNFNNVVDDIIVKDTSTNFGNTLKVDDEPVMLEKPELISQTYDHQEQTKPEQSEKSQRVSSILSNAYNKVMNGVVDLLQLRSGLSEAESCTLFSKRGCSPKPRDKKRHNVSSGRGRGRAKSQLRRSGVSQTRHRKERSRYDQSEDIKSDIDNWEELEYYSNSDDDEQFEDVCDFMSTQYDAEEIQHTKRPMNFTFADIKPKRKKPRKNRSNSWAQLSMSFHNLDEDEAENKDKLMFRPRVLSESSVDSEDSYCIVFEKEGCTEESDYETEDDSQVDTESETETEDEEVTIDSDIETRQPKVRFNLKPTVHRMIKWEFAYRMARPGPWEQMVRDRDRFRSRINYIGRVLEPILAKKHRMHVFHERFET